MVLPHFYAEYDGGEIEINDEYSDYLWLPTNGLDDFEPMIDTIPQAVFWTRQLGQAVKQHRGLTKL